MWITLWKVQNSDFEKSDFAQKHKTEKILWKLIIC